MLASALLGACSSATTIDVHDWYEVVSARVGREVMDASMRRKIEESGCPWKAHDRRTGIDMVLVMPSEFLMGSPESERGRAQETVVWTDCGLDGHCVRHCVRHCVTTE